MAGSPPTSGKTPLQKSLSRRVSFNEATLAKSAQSGNVAAPAAKSHHRDRPIRPPPSIDGVSSCDMESQAPTSRPKPKCSSRFNSCCAWASIIFGILLVIFLLLGGIYFAFLQSNLPEVHLQRLDINRLEVNNTETDTLITTDFEVRLNSTNKNGKIELSYGPMTAFIASEGIDLGRTKLDAMLQKPETSTDIKVRTQLKREAVEEAAAKDLEDNSKIHMLVVDVEVKGHIDFLVNGRKMNGFPFKILCNSIDQSEIDNGHAPKCNVKMSPIY